MVGRALDGEVERDLQAVLVRGLDEPAEVLEGAEFGWIASWPPSSGADGVGAAGIAGRASRLLFWPLRLVRPIGWIGGK